LACRVRASPVFALSPPLTLTLNSITFEKIPSDYATLKIHTTPETGGDTLWASAYEAYDRLSPEFAKFLEGLTAKHDANWFYDIAEAQGNKIRTVERGAPANVGGDLSAIHPSKSLSWTYLARVH